MSNYHSSAAATTSSSSAIGINSQPYRSYLSDRSHFYQTTLGINNVSSSPQTTSSTFNSYQSSSPTTPTTSGLNYTSGTSPATTTTDSSNTKSNTQLGNSRVSLNSTSSGTRLQLKSNSNNTASKTRNGSSTSSMAVTTEYKANAHNTDVYDDDDEDEVNQPSACSKCFFGLLWCVAQIGLWGAVLLLLFWFFKFDKGFAWQNDKRKQFNLHAFLMLTGFIFVNGQSMLVYKTYLCCQKICNKITHAIFFVLSISLVSFGMLIAIQAQHITQPDQTPVHFYSLHSWIGLVTCGLFALQFFFGFVTFLVLLCCDRATSGYRARFLPVHVTFGLTIFLLATAACLTGLLQTARSRLTGPTPTEPIKADYKADMWNIVDYNPFTNSGLVLNAVGGCLIALAVLIPYMVRNFGNRRPEIGATSFRINHS